MVPPASGGFTGLERVCPQFMWTLIILIAKGPLAPFACICFSRDPDG